MKITKSNNTATVEFGNTLNKRVKVLFIFEAILYSFLSLFFTWLAFNEFSKEVAKSNYGYAAKYTTSIGFIVSMLFLTVAASVSLFAFIRFLSRITTKEKLLITSERLEISTNSVLRNSAKSYDIDGITFMQYRGAPGKTDHPLKGKSFDYLGFDTQEALIGSVNTDGNIGFMYNGKKVNFGKDVYSWDAEKINKLLDEITGGLLFIDSIPSGTDDWGEDNDN